MVRSICIDSIAGTKDLWKEEVKLKLEILIVFQMALTSWRIIFRKHDADGLKNVECIDEIRQSGTLTG